MCMTQNGEGEPGQDSCPRNLLCWRFITLVIHAQAFFPESFANDHSLLLTMNLALSSRGLVFSDHEKLQRLPLMGKAVFAPSPKVPFSTRSTEKTGCYSRKDNSPEISQILILLPTLPPASCINFCGLSGLSSPPFPTTRSCCGD